jgi:hypothetical protein
MRYLDARNFTAAFDEDDGMDDSRFKTCDAYSNRTFITLISLSALT